MSGGHGSGGEYEIQEGFGWTNGVIMDLLWRYSAFLTIEDPIPPPAEALEQANNVNVFSSGITSITTALVALLVSLIAGFLG